MDDTARAGPARAVEIPRRHGTPRRLRSPRASRIVPHMELLSDGDVRQMLDFLHEASEVDGPDAFTEPIVDAFCRLIPADGGAACIAVTGAAPGVAPEARTLLSFSDLRSEWCANIQTPWTDEMEDVCRRYIEHQDPTPPTPRFINRALRESDVLSRREWQRLELCQLVKSGTEDALNLWLAVPGEQTLRRIRFSSARRGGSSDRDVRVLELLIPHLARLYARAARRRAALPALGELTPREHEVICLVAQGRTNREIAHLLWITSNTVRKHLENIFEKLGVGNRTAAAARALGTPPGDGIGGTREPR
jgi:DNA-binding CsgD family transcriptional regulator